MEVKQIAQRAKIAAVALAAANNETKNQALVEVKRELLEKKEEIITANQDDLQRSIAENLAPPLLKRLKFDESKILEACEGLESLIKLPDPVGTRLSGIQLDEGLELYKVTAPIGVIGVIFESRPDALVQISSLCLKSGNAVLLKGGSEATMTNRILADIIISQTVKAGIPEGWLGLLETRTEVVDMLAMGDCIDLVIPRGSNEFVQYIMDNTTIPVLGHADGICHIYVDKNADLTMAEKICVDSKCQYVAVCNAAETFLIHENIANRFLPDLKSLLDDQKVEIRGCEKTRAIIDAIPATQEDWKTEYLDLIISIKVVSSMEEAIEHINTHGSGHTDVIVTQKLERGTFFMHHVDSANVFLNCSSRFADGFRYGLGAEVGTSTNKIHARGPVGMEGLMIYKWHMYGNGHVVADYSGKDGKPFTHKSIIP
ncbi:MAG: glutamate-5-semialdehyde dehydrogenase [Anaerolineales bacterium]